VKISGLPTILKVDGDKRVHEESTHLLSLAKKPIALYYRFVALSSPVPFRLFFVR
jgi:hypothetical protein